MSRLTPHISPSAVLMGYKLPIPLKIVLVFGFVVLILGLETTLFETHQYSVAAEIFIVFGGLLAFIYTNNSGYRIAWDETQVYMREWGFRNLLFQRRPYHAIAYDDIAGMEGRFGTNAAAKSRFMPYEYLEIASAVGDEDIWIYPLSIKGADLATFLVHLHGKRPDIFPEEVLALMRQDGLIKADPQHQ